MGPYAFTKHRRKLNISFSPNGSTVSFNEYYWYEYVENLSRGSLDDSVTTLNLALVGAIEAILARTSSRFAPWLALLARLVEGWRDPRIQGTFTTRTVEELLFGYDDPLLVRAARVLPGAGITPRVSLVRNMSGPEESGPEDRDCVATGASDLSETWQYKRWHGRKQIHWRPPFVEPVGGTDATQFAPSLHRGSNVSVWVGEAYRSLVLVNVNLTDPIRVGAVPVLRYRPEPSQREPDPRHDQEVVGLMNISYPSSGARGIGPFLFLSLPGFCGVDKAVADGVEGISCDPSNHVTFLDVEPTSGITLRAKKALMLSSWFGQRYKAVEPGVVDTVLPIFWVDETSEARPSQLAQFRPLVVANALLYFLEKGAAPTALALALLGAILLVAGASLGGPSRGEWDEDVDGPSVLGASQGGGRIEDEDVEALLTGGGTVTFPSRPIVDEENVT